MGMLVHFDGRRSLMYFYSLSVLDAYLHTAAASADEIKTIIDKAEYIEIDEPDSYSENNIRFNGDAINPECPKEVGWLPLNETVVVEAAWKLGLADV